MTLKKLFCAALALALCLGPGAPALAHSDPGIPGQTVTIAAGHWTMACVGENGDLYMWGDNYLGQQGNGKYNTTADIAAPVKVLENVVSVALGYNHSLAVDADGALWAWGETTDGELGIGTTGNKSFLPPMGSRYQVQTEPIKVMEDVAAVSAGYGHTLVLKTDGTLWACGNNGSGRLGNGTNAAIVTPVQVLDHVTAVSTGLAHTAAIRDDGSLWMWGNNQYGSLGFEGGNSTSSKGRSYQTEPVRVMEGVASVSAGDGTTLAVKTDGSLWAWGRNNYGQLGDGTTEDSFVPIKIMDGVAAASAGQFYSAALKTDGSLWTWGENYDGRLGNGTTEDSAVPVKVMDGVAAVSAGAGTTAALKTDGTLWTWGGNSYGMMGRGSKGSGAASTTPVQIMTGVALPRAFAVPGPEPEITFEDVPADSYYEPAVAWAVRKGVTVGKSEESFAPFDTCTRGEVVTFLWRAAGEPEPRTSYNPFHDVSEADYYYKPVLWAVENGVTSGTGEGEFTPGQTCSRAHIITFLWRAMGKPDAASASALAAAYADEWYTGAVGWADAAGLLGGTAEAFTPAGSCPRADVVTYMYRVLG